MPTTERIKTRFARRLIGDRFPNTGILLKNISNVVSTVIPDGKQSKILSSARNNSLHPDVQDAATLPMLLVKISSR
jgi:hypothetical protein